MDYKIRISEPALADLDPILEYSWTVFPATADRLGSGLLDLVALLGKFPYIGSYAAGWPGVRQLVHTPIIIFYRVDESREAVEILHFWHAKRLPPGR